MLIDVTLDISILVRFTFKEADSDGKPTHDDDDDDLSFSLRSEMNFAQASESISSRKPLIGESRARQNRGEQGTIALSGEDKTVVLSSLSSSASSGAENFSKPKGDDNTNLFQSKSVLKDSKEWYYGSINRLESEGILDKCPENSFLVRTSSVPGCYALSRCTVSTKVFIHYVITPVTDGYSVQNACPPDSTVYQTLGDLVANTPVLTGYTPAGKFRPS